MADDWYAKISMADQEQYTVVGPLSAQQMGSGTV